MNRVIVNSSPIIALSMIHQIELLWTLFDEVIVPEGVYHEISVSAGKNNYGKAELESAVQEKNIRMYSVRDAALVSTLLGRLHRGEIEVIVGGREQRVNFVLLDDMTARKMAEAFSLVPIGTIGILRLAKKQGILESIKSYLDVLRRKEFRVSDKIYDEILTKENEH